METDRSLALYGYVCKYIVGTEDHVKIIRIQNSIIDRYNSTIVLQQITSGSVGEGLKMKGSDLDLMHISKFICVDEESFVSLDLYKTYLRTSFEETQPGFTRLERVFGNNPMFNSMCVDEGKRMYFSSKKFRSFFSFGQLTYIHGPCLSNADGTIDQAVCIHSKLWTSQAFNWPIRSNNLWPPNELKQTIIDHGVLYVPVGVKASIHENLEWRLSFSVAEKFLIYSFSHTQLLCHALMKILLKDVINSINGCKDLLCSYFIKTIIFWVSEEMSISYWQPSNLIPCFMRCFQRLVYCVKFSVCPHFFIPEFNLFENKIKGNNRIVLLEKLNNLYSYGWRSILFSDQLVGFNCQSQPFLWFESSFKLVSSLASGNTNIYKRFMIRVANCIRHAFHICKGMKHYYVYAISRSLGDQINLNTISYKQDTYTINKDRYKHYREILFHVLLSINHDAVSGWLRLASLFYKMKQYLNALYVLQYASSKCTPDKIYIHKQSELSDLQCHFLNSNTFKKIGLLGTIRVFSVEGVTLSTSLFPTEGKPFVEDYVLSEGGSAVRTFFVVCLDFSIGMPLDSYMFYLTFLCHFHLGNVKQCYESVEGLYDTVVTDDIKCSDSMQCLLYNLLLQALKMIGNDHRRRTVYKHAKKKLRNTANLKYL